MDVWLHSKLSNKFKNSYQWQPFGSYIVLILVTQIIAVDSICTYDIVSAVEISVSYDMIPHNISAWHDISMVGYDARMVYYCNESIWYQDNVYQYYMMYQSDMVYQYDMTRQQYDIIFRLKLG